MKFKSTALLMPMSEEGQMTHKAVLSALSQGQNIPEEDGKFCFKVIRSPEIYPMQLVQAKGTGLPVQCNPVTKELHLEAYDFLIIKLDLSTSRTVSIFDSDNKPVLKDSGKPARKDIAYAPSSKEFEPFLQSIMANAGFELVRVMSVGSYHKTQVKKTSNKFFIPHCEVELSVSVVDSDKAELAIALGVGKHRSYGYGYIEILEQICMD
ncbi:type I-E CRISPR-associated protein Cas6/Cse3/CasE (plasmid) [Shewanella xiamenensis]|uniref:Type I-E CRISPR-associated protein Cas6/Cse3/CasE n=1 Tax=Shewanella xiamenensis TaxID=332186 RepID=A0ABT6UDR6_9GAMM|nr:type I-E CRISPR-associated protein Cas6/Cse3/CasE [Shewanella xiamenensis]MDI5832614.1 type I-E CRISPR-associated protein Cas6/Cse3/CasE [Shewanella xiamenensis]WHF57769.1 type I-E CRISPR-associated protein Cas6/Cse3/CasE [Shewanella xiamenensis]